jgi:Tfp pilus assembly protein PilF
LATILHEQNRIAEAIENYIKAIHLKPDFTEAYYNLANILRAQNRTDEAIDNYKQAIRLKPELIKAYNALGEILNERNCYAETIELLKQAIQFNPDNSEVYNNMAATLMMQGHYSQALKNFKHSIKLTPGYAKTHANMGLLLLLTGQFIDGWKEYQWRLDPEVNVIQGDFDQPRWDGSSFAGKRLLVNHEQGFGDTLQFIRYLPMVKDRGGTVIFRERKSVLALLGQFPGIDEFSEVTTDAPPKINFDYHVSLLSLPGIFATTLETIPAEVPYLYADPAKAEYWRKKLCGTEFKVGIVWAGTAKHKNDHNRSCKLEDFAVLARIDGVRLYGLQKGKIATEVENLSEDIDITNLGEEFEDFADTAAAIENLDLIISVDTAVAHLAGAMGKPVWILLPFTPDWRWMLERQDSPWYPTAKLFRQEIHGDWDEVLNRVATKLRSLV